MMQKRKNEVSINNGKGGETSDSNLHKDKKDTSKDSAKQNMLDDAGSLASETESITTNKQSHELSVLFGCSY